MTGILEGTSGAIGTSQDLLPLELFDPVPISLNDGRILSRENLPGDVVDGAVKILSCMEALARDTGFEVDDEILMERVEKAVFETTHSQVRDSMYAEVSAKGISVRLGGFDHAAADSACRLSYCLLKPTGRFTNPSRIRADDRTCTNILTMAERMVSFLDVMGPARRICFRFRGGYGDAVDDGYGLFVTDGCLWDVTTSHDPLPPDARLRLLVRYALSLGSKDPALGSITNIGIMNPRLHCAYMMPAESIPEEALIYVTQGIIGRDSVRPRGASPSPDSMD